MPPPGKRRGKPDFVELRLDVRLMGHAFAASRGASWTVRVRGRRSTDSSCGRSPRAIQIPGCGPWWAAWPGSQWSGL